jgi:hypothetical protein
LTAAGRADILPAHERRHERFDRKTLLVAQLASGVGRARVKDCRKAVFRHMQTHLSDAGDGFFAFWNLTGKTMQSAMHVIE